VTDRRSAVARIWELTATPGLDGNASIVLIRGRLGHSTAPEFAATVRRLADAGAGRIVVDFTEVAYLSSAGLAVLASLTEELKGAGRQLTVRSPAHPARLALELAGLAGLIED
jgi:anti-sigma B factor antagonist